MLDWNRADALSREHGQSFFVLDEAAFRRNFLSLRDAFAAHYPDVRIGYSYKTNYTPRLCQIVHELGGFAEVVSEMEYALAKRLDVPGPRIIFNGPYKAEDAFHDAALSGATINLDSLRDVRMLRAVAAANPGQEIAVVIRCNFELTDGEVSRFGMDIDGAEFAGARAAIDETPNLSLKGLHCHFPDRDLESFRRRAERMVTLIRAVFPDAPPEIVNIGGGYFSHMPDSLRATFATPPATFADYGKTVGEVLSRAFAGAGKPPTLFMEPGTAIAADTQKFYTRVISTKSVRGKNFATVAGSSFDISPTARSRNLPVTALHQPGGTAAAAPFDIVGFTCIEKDILSEGVTAPIVVDDFLCYSNVGSYSVVMKPPFILPANPILSIADGEVRLIKRRETTDYIFQNFVF